MLKKIVRCAFLTLSFVLGAEQVLAIPALPVRKRIRLANGTEVMATLRGDERAHYYTLDDGRVVAAQADGKLHISSMREVKQRWEQQMKQAEELKADHERKLAGQGARKVRRKVGVPKDASLFRGQRKGLVILVSFSDLDFADSDPKAMYDVMFNKENCTDYELTGSVHDYFMDQSYGQFDLTFDIVGPVKLPNSYKFYGGNTTKSNGDKGDDQSKIQQMIIYATNAVDKDVDYAKYDWDDDGQVDQVYFIYAGKSEADGAGADYIWPHAYAVYNRELKYDGKRIFTYACSNEMGTDNRHSGIGVACHEFSHCMNLPDMYDIDYSGEDNLQQYDLMSAGGRNNNGRTPVGYSAYERWFSGWLTPTEISSETRITNMRPLHQHPEAYILYNDANRDEYYLLENRQTQKWFAIPRYGGLLPFHIDFDKNVWEANGPNDDPDHNRISILLAKKPLQLSGRPYPNGTLNSITDTTTPAATLFNTNLNGTKLLGKSITEITQNADGTVSFLACAGIRNIKPQANQPTNITTTGFTASWQPVPDATSYEVSVQSTKIAPTNIDDAVMLEVDFEDHATNTLSNNDVSGTLGTLIGQGWSGRTVYTNKAGLQLGKGSVAGKLTTPYINAPISGKLSIVYGYGPADGETSGKGALWIINEDNSKIGLNLDSNNNTLGLVSVKEGDISGNRFHVEFEGKPTLTATFLLIFDGQFSLDEINAYLQRKYGNGGSPAPRNIQVSTVNAGATDNTLEADTQSQAAPLRIPAAYSNYTTQATSYNLANLDASQAYSVRVRAVTPNGLTLWSDPIKVVNATNAVQGLQAATPERQTPWYNLQGQRIQQPARPGIYIKNGRKVIVN